VSALSEIDQRKRYQKLDLNNTELQFIKSRGSIILII